jgi:hypothetical protein
MDESEQLSGAEPKQRWFDPACAIILYAAVLTLLLPAAH